MFNVVDLSVLLVLLYFAWRGYENGFLSGSLNLLSTVLSTAMAILFYPQVATLLNQQFNLGMNLANILGFFGLLLGVEILLSFLSSFVYTPIFKSFFRLKLLFSLDKVLGVVPASLVALFFATIFLLLPTTLPFDFGLREPIQTSWVGKNLLPRAYALEPSLQKVLKRLPTQSLFFVITPSPVSREVSQLVFPKDLKFGESPQEEAKMLQLLNSERVGRGLKPLKLDLEIVPVARAHSKDMFVRGYFSHYNPEGESAFERMDKAQIRFLAAGENLAYAPAVEIAHQGLMNSPGHKENILRKEFGRVGIGVIDGGLYGKMFTQNFTD